MSSPNMFRDRSTHDRSLPTVTAAAGLRESAQEPRLIPAEPSAVEELTRRATGPDWQYAQRRMLAQYESWGATLGLAPTDLEQPDVLAAWLHDAHPDWAWATAKQSISAIGAAFVAQGRANPAAGAKVRRLLVSYRRDRRTGDVRTRAFLPRHLMQEPVMVAGSPQLHVEILTAAISLGRVHTLSLIELADLTADDAVLSFRAPTVRAVLAPADPATRLHSIGATAVARLTRDATHERLFGTLLGESTTGSRKPIANRLARMLRRAAERSRVETSVERRSPIAVGLSPQETLLWISDGAPDSMMRTRDRALLACGFGLRARDLGRLNLRDLTTGSDGHQVILRESKTDPYGIGRELWWEHTGGSHCPHCALSDWIGYLDRHFPEHDGALFPSIHGETLSGGRVTTRAVSQAVRRHCRSVGIDPDQYSSRSLRVGGVTAAAEAGADIDELMELAGHRDERSTPIYLRNEHVTRARMDL